MIISQIFADIPFFFLLSFGSIGFELRALHLLGRLSTT
jgi:hypothetical protein